MQRELLCPFGIEGPELRTYSCKGVTQICHPYPFTISPMVIKHVKNVTLGTMSSYSQVVRASA